MNEDVRHVLPEFRGAWAMIVHPSDQACDACRTQTKVKEKK